MMEYANFVVRFPGVHLTHSNKLHILRKIIPPFIRWKIIQCAVRTYKHINKYIRYNIIIFLFFFRFNTPSFDLNPQAIFRLAT